MGKEEFTAWFKNNPNILSHKNKSLVTPSNECVYSQFGVIKRMLCNLKKIHYEDILLLFETGKEEKEGKIQYKYISGSQESSLLWLAIHLMEYPSPTPKIRLVSLDLFWYPERPLRSGYMTRSGAPSEVDICLDGSIVEEAIFNSLFSYDLIYLDWLFYTLAFYLLLWAIQIASEVMSL